MTSFCIQFKFFSHNTSTTFAGTSVTGVSGSMRKTNKLTARLTMTVFNLRFDESPIIGFFAADIEGAVVGLLRNAAEAYNVACAACDDRLAPAPALVMTFT